MKTCGTWLKALTQYGGSISKHTRVLDKDREKESSRKREVKEPLCVMKTSLVDLSGPASKASLDFCSQISKAPANASCLQHWCPEAILFPVPHPDPGIGRAIVSDQQDESGLEQRACPRGLTLPFRLESFCHHGNNPALDG